MSKYGNINIWKYFTDLFDYLPLAAVIESKIFCLHGGLSPDIKSLDQINELDRICETPMKGPLSNLLFSYPDERIGWALIPRPRSREDYIFGYDIAKEFNHNNKLNMIVSGLHRFGIDGYFWYHNKQTLTIFSVPNCSYRIGNKAAIIEIDEYLNNTILQFGPNPILKRKDQDKEFTKRIPDYFL